MYDFGELKKNIEGVENWLTQELSLVRTGRATPLILDSIEVEVYGSKMGIKELANIVVEDIRTIKIEPWDTSVLKAIEKSIITSNLGLSLTPFERGIRIIFPELTSERREQLIKLAKQKLEEARVSLRGFRDKAWTEIQEREKKGGMGEDDKFRFKDDMQKLVDESGKKLEVTLDRKVQEIRGQ